MKKFIDYYRRNKKLQTLGKVKLPVRYGDFILEQDFIITSGILEACILGVDAAFKHEYVLCGRTKTIFLARDKAGRVPVYSSDNLMTSVKKVTTFPLTCMVVKARMSRSQYQLLPSFPFLFTHSKELPEGITVDQFLGETNDKGEYNLLIRNISSRLINLPRGISLGNVETACQLIEKLTQKTRMTHRQLKTKRKLTFL